MHFTLPRDKTKDMVEIVYNRNCVYQTAYHVIWCPKYRKRILKGEIAEALRLAITAICIEREWPILTLEIQPDHIHLFVTIPPSTGCSRCRKDFEGFDGPEAVCGFPGVEGSALRRAFVVSVLLRRYGWQCQCGNHQALH